jgi:hypothetical protein
LHGKLAGGVIRFDPLDLAVRQGRLKLSPQIALNTTPAVLVLPQERVAEKVHISPEMCHTWLKYVAPLLAEATRTEGEMSIDLEGAQVPLTDPAGGAVRGTLSVHSAKVGPGPLGQQIEAVVRQVKAIADGRPLDAQLTKTSSGWITLPQQATKFQLAERRVYHDRLQFVVGDVEVVTQGSVGMDQTLALKAVIPVREQWIKGESPLRVLSGQSLEIPISGTLSSPAVDNRVLANLTRQVLGGAVEKVIEDQLRKGLQDFFAPKR